MFSSGRKKTCNDFFEDEKIMKTFTAKGAEKRGVKSKNPLRPFAASAVKFY